MTAHDGPYPDNRLNARAEDGTSGFAFLLEDQFAMLAFTSAVEVLRQANTLSGQPLYPYRFVSLEDRPMQASNGAVLQMTAAIADLRRSDTLVLVSGGAALDRQDPALSGFLRRAARHGHRIWGVSSGVIRLAEAGLLGDQPVSAHWADMPHLQERFPDIAVASSLFTMGPRVATCAGGSAAADLMLHHIEMTAPAGLAAAISAQMVIDRIRDGRATQQLPTKIRYQSADAKVQLALTLMEAFLADPLQIAQIAEKVGVSQRQLERLFLAEFDRPPSKLYHEMRLERARYDLLVTHRPIIEIAMDYGFSPSNFTKLYKAVFGLTPRDERATARRKGGPDGPDA